MLVWSSATGVYYEVRGAAFRAYLYFKGRPRKKERQHVVYYATALEAALAYDRCSVKAQPFSSPAFDP